MNTYSPLRYPGGKSQLSKYVLSILEENNLIGGTYAEPYAGGAGVAVYLLLNKHVSKIYINDIDPAIYSFWYSVKYYTDKLCALIKDTKVDVDTWLVQKQVQKNKGQYSILEVGFSTFFLNRTNRSGILKGGIIGGKKQNGKYKMDCRFNKSNLIKRIEAIAGYSDNIIVSKCDAIEFLELNQNNFNDKTLIYLDPPYYDKGHQLYVDFYTHSDHVKLKECVQSTNYSNWIITYDNTEKINTIYEGFNKEDLYIRYSAAQKRVGQEILIYSPQLSLPEIV